MLTRIKTDGDINRYCGLSTDTKPTDGVPNMSEFSEIDTSKKYVFDEENGQWVEDTGSGGGGGGGGTNNYDNLLNRPKINNVTLSGNKSLADLGIVIPDVSGLATKAELEDVTEVIPEQATAQNQLADKAFVNSTVGTNTAIFRGTYDLVNDLGLTAEATEAQIASALESEITTVTNNDYCFVFYINATSGITEYYDRYKYSQDDGFAFEFRLNNSSFTAVQWAAINSNITAALVALLSGMTHETWTFTLDDDTTVTKEVVVWQST